MTYQIGTSSAPGYVDSRRSYKDESENRIVTGDAVFTANATGGTTTTIVGDNADPETGTNVARIGDEFKLFDSSDELKEETVFRVTEIAVAAETTVTFTPAAAEATASGDYYKLVANAYSHGEVDRRLSALGFSDERISTMTENDKMYQLRVSDDPGSL